MMPCISTCSISAIFIIGMIYMNTMVSNSHTIVNYKNQLSPKLQKIYEEITKERLEIYYKGYILGFVLSIIIILLNIYIYKNKKMMSTSSMVCTTLAVSFFTNYFYYILSPKKNWMLDYVKTPEETQSWLHMYRNMQVYYHSGLVLGIIAVGIFTFAFRKHT